MPSAREIVEGPSGKKPVGFFASLGGRLGLKVDWNKLSAQLKGFASTGFEFGTIGYTWGRQIGWYVVTTAMITALPLVFEYNREIQVEQMEELQVADALEKGANPMNLAQQGMSSAVEPKVLKS